ncbi:Met-10+ like-protein-domain-containing protein [Lipomyces tetrasporus]|uniref:tRNA (guanine(37)-N1)-methyltransferase n=1 Tax=Lipomyces tetrasporus TaxID=54092 RepID=A0AAD7QT06_9ASCO|nr:Met-10+ like-protein-domain-containing protein [Lipomyces tetrasporus]KAJ8100446.1 Met-10+ like-protein-domain-containing protein [Lipomyces tetrasporus]
MGRLSRISVLIRPRRYTATTVLSHHKLGRLLEKEGSTRYQYCRQPRQCQATLDPHRSFLHHSPSSSKSLAGSISPAEYHSKMSDSYDEDNFHPSPPVHRIAPAEVPDALDKSQFTVHVELTALKIDQPRELPIYRRQFKNDLLLLRSVSNIVKVDKEEGTDKVTDILLVLRPDIKLDLRGMSEELTAFLKERPGVEVLPYSLELGYDFWRADEILSGILPPDLLGEIPSGFTMTGHIAHMNLRDEYLPYKHIIGQLILDKNPKVRTVVNKLDSIDTVFRTFEMEVLAGEPDLYVEQHESNCRFQFDFSKVYWNSRLHTEHDRLISTFEPGEAVCDVFAGVGPFAVPAGKKNVIVLANDLNRHSYDSLVHNIKLNKVDKTVFPYNLDGREFIRISRHELKRLAETKKKLIIPARSRHAKDESGKRKVEIIQIPTRYSHYVMNLPDSAISFLDAFRGLYAGDHEQAELPYVHVHCFHKSDPNAPKPPNEEVQSTLRQRIACALGFDIPLSALSFHFVRAVAPTKGMYCVTFLLPKEVAFAKDDA